MVTVMPWQRAVLYRRGRFVRILEPGRHRSFALGRRIEYIDVRAERLTVTGQEVPTADQVPVKVGARVVLRIVDPRRWVEATEDPYGFVHDAVKTVIRDLVRGSDFEDVAAGIRVDGVPDSLVDVARGVGATVEAFEVVDVVAPGDVKRAAAELVTARRRAQVALAEARSQTAVLRHLANVSSVLESNPALAALKLVETAAEHGGSIVVERPSAPRS